jgi:SAM-dependent methyltransferase
MNEVQSEQYLWYGRIPVELHGHRKKVDFFVRELEKFRASRGCRRDQISILEIGCSNGRNVSLPLAERGYDVTGVDLHEPSIAWANANNSFPNARFICQDAAVFHSERTFDVIVLSDILEHVDEPEQLLALTHQLLGENGMVLVCIPNGFGPGEVERKLVEVTRIDRLLRLLRAGINRLRRRQRTPYNEDSGHVQYFRMSTLRRLTERCGFVIEESGKGALFGGNLTYPLGMLFPALAAVSLRCANHLPFWMISTWYFRLRRSDGAAKMAADPKTR